MEPAIIVGIDVGTTKVCTLVARVEVNRKIRILGVGIEPSKGMKKGVVVDLASTTQAIRHSIDKAEKSSGVEITEAYVSLAGAHVESLNNPGVTSISRQVVDHRDVERAIDSARAVTIPHNMEVIHIIQRGFTVDGQDGIDNPLGMHGYRMEVEAHIIMAAASIVDNIRKCVTDAGVQVLDFVLNPLASAEVVLSDTEREMGAIVIDVGGGTTDMAIFIENNVWHTYVLGVGGNHVSSDIAHGLNMPFSMAEEIKLQHGHADLTQVSEHETFPVQTFTNEEPQEISRMELVNIIEARVEEIFDLLRQEIKRSGYDGLLPAGVILTGGCSLLPGIEKVASRVLDTPVRIARPSRLVGLVDRLKSPAFSTSVGLLKWAAMLYSLDQEIAAAKDQYEEEGTLISKIIDLLKRFLP